LAANAQIDEPEEGPNSLGIAAVWPRLPTQSRECPRPDAEEQMQQHERTHEAGDVPRERSAPDRLAQRGVDHVHAKDRRVRVAPQANKRQSEQ
jgi:hypothetical protein